jgi:type VI secretion system protein VasI
VQWLIGFLILVLFPVGASAGGLADCTKLKLDAERMACYQAEIMPGMIKVGNWELMSSVSPLDDSKTVSAILRSDNTFLSRLGTELSNATFFVRCREGVTDVYFSFGDHFMADVNNWGVVKSRVDKRPARTHRMIASTDNLSLGLWSGSGVRLLKSIEGANSLFLRAVPFNGSPIEVTFSVAQAKAAFIEIRKSCKW